MVRFGGLVQIAAFCLFAVGSLVVTPAAAIDFGDDTSEWANDGECDDPRFTGPGMTATALLDADILHDATDCQQAFNANRVQLKSKADAAVDFGDDSSQWSNDGECDDPRFEGAGMTTTTLLDSDIRHDATDCRQAYEAGRLTLRSATSTASTSIDFGDDSSQWANDGECDDPRFTGSGMTETTLLDSDIRHDATDCRTAYEAGNLTLR